MQIPKKSRVKEKITYPWTLLKEPKFISAMWATVYSIFIVNGIILVAFTPLDVVRHNGIPITYVGGFLFIIGGACGVSSLHGGKWFIERAGIYFNIAGMLAYGAIIWLFDTSLQEGAIRTGFAIALILALLARFYKIRELTLDPNK